jgi:hypothetical protein
LSGLSGTSDRDDACPAPILALPYAAFALASPLAHSPTLLPSQASARGHL